MGLPLTPPTGSTSAISAATSEVPSRAVPISPGSTAEARLPGAGKEPQSTQPTQKELQQAVDELQRKVQTFAPDLRFSVDHDTGRTVVTVTDADTQELIRQIPAEEALRLAKEIDRMEGLLFHKQA